MESYIEGLFKNDDTFLFEVDLIIKYIWRDSSKFSYIENQGSPFYEDLSKVFTNNINKLAKETSEGFRVIFGVNIEYYFDKDKNGNTLYITRDLLPSNAKYIKEVDDISKNAILAGLTHEKLNEMFSTPKATLFIAHDKNGNFIVINSESINVLPKNIIEGYRHNPTGEVFHNLILNKPGSRNILFGRVKFTSSGQIEIQDEDWFMDFLKSSYHLTKETRESQLRFIQSNGKETEVNVYSLNYFTVFGYVAGSQFINTIQETKTNLIPTVPYTPYLPASSSLRENKLTSLKYNLPSKIVLEDKYGKECVEKFYEIFQSLFLPGGKEISSESVIPLVHKFLAALNGRQVATQRGEENINKFIPGPDIDQINLRINELFKTIGGNFDKDSFLKFIWRNDDKDGTFRGGSQSQKMWINNLFGKIKDYTGTNQDLIRAHLELELFRQKSGYANSFDMGNNKYTKQEAKLANKVLELTNNIFGHFIVRLTFATMVDYYSGASGIEIKIKQRPKKGLLEQFRHVGLIPSATVYDAPLNYLRTENTIKHLFGYFFLSSPLRLDLESSEQTNHYDIEFPYGPLVFIDQSITQQLIKGESKIWGTSADQKLSMALGEMFQDHYYKYLKLDKFSDFVDSQTNLFNFLKEKVIREANFLLMKGAIVTYGQMTSIISRALTKLRQGIFRAKAGEGQSMRRTIDDFLKDSHDTRLKLTILDNFYIYITQKELLSVEFSRWGGTRELYSEKDYYKTILSAYRKQQIKNIVNTLEKIIESGDLGGGKVRLIPIFSDDGVGYQYEEHKNWLQPYIPRKPLDIDLSNPDNTLYQLEHVAYMMNTFDCVFIMTEAGETLSAGSGNQKIVDKMILAFNRDGLLRLEDIFSLPPVGTHSDYSAFQIVVNSYSFGILPYDLFETLYNNAWAYEFIFSHSTSSGWFHNEYMGWISLDNAALQALNLPPYIIF